MRILYESYIFLAIHTIFNIVNMTAFHLPFRSVLHFIPLFRLISILKMRIEFTNEHTQHTKLPFLKMLLLLRRHKFHIHAMEIINITKDSFYIQIVGWFSNEIVMVHLLFSKKTSQKLLTNELNLFRFMECNDLFKNTHTHTPMYAYTQTPIRTQ